MFAESQWEHQIPWSWSYRRLWASPRGWLKLNPGALLEQSIFNCVQTLQHAYQKQNKYFFIVKLVVCYAGKIGLVLILISTKYISTDVSWKSLAKKKFKMQVKNGQRARIMNTMIKREEGKERHPDIWIPNMLGSFFT